MMTKSFQVTLYVSSEKFPGQKRFVRSDEFEAFLGVSGSQNTGRKNYVNPIVKARRLAGYLKRDPKLSKTKLAKKLRMSRVRVTQLLNLLKIPTDLQEEILKIPRISERSLRPLTYLDSPDAMRIMWQQIRPTR